MKMMLRASPALPDALRVSCARRADSVPKMALVASEALRKWRRLVVGDFMGFGILFGDSDLRLSVVGNWTEEKGPIPASGFPDGQDE